MFQTEPIAWLQSFSSPWLDFFMRTLSFLGTGEITAVVLIIVIFGFRIRAGMAILLAVLLGSALTNSLKNVFEYPRPVFLSEAVGEPGDDSPPPTMFDNGGGADFWSLPKPDAIDTMRNLHRIHDEGADGLPSGHVTAAVTLSFGLAIFLGGARFIPFAMGWVVLMALSRMYLGRHFLADVLLGAIIGLTALLIAMLATKSLRKDDPKRSLPWIVALGALSGAFVLYPKSELTNLGELAGLTVGLAILILQGIPNDIATPTRRIARVLLGGVVYVLMVFVAEKLNPEDLSTGEFWQGLALMSVTCFATVLIAKRIKLYES